MKSVVEKATPGADSGGHVYRKLDELGAMHMRTREDVVEIKTTVRALVEGQARHEKRMAEFEADVDRRIGESRQHTALRIDGLAGEVKTIREERIAEKAQWRGPEKVIAVIGSIATLIGLIAAVKGLFF